MKNQLILSVGDFEKPERHSKYVKPDLLSDIEKGNVTFCILVNYTLLTRRIFWVPSRIKSQKF